MTYITPDSVVSGISSLGVRNCYQKAAWNAILPQLHCFLSCTFPSCLLPWELEMLFLQQVILGSCKQHTSVFPWTEPSSTVDNVLIPWGKKKRQLIKTQFLSCMWSYLTYFHCCLLTCSVPFFVYSQFSVLKSSQHQSLVFCFWNAFVVTSFQNSSSRHFH